MPNIGEIFLARRDTLCTLHRKDKGVRLDSELWYDLVPKSVDTIHEVKVTILWNQQVQIDRTTLINRPDIIMRDNAKGNM
jgi:hypothetical protein